MACVWDQQEQQTWNQKNLDYEIETIRNVQIDPITFKTWNQKNLDYEIETKILTNATGLAAAWNQKNLDYEIETMI